MNKVLRAFAPSLAIIGVLIKPVAAQSPSTATWVVDTDFNAVFDMYWRSQLIGRYAGNRLCAFKQRFNFDDPRSPFRPIDQRLFAAGVRLEKIFPKALNTVAPPYAMPPSQLLCDDERSAYEAIFAFETSVTALERMLDNLSKNTAVKKKTK